MIFKYRTYGLEVESEIECDNLLAGQGEADVQITLGPVPSRLANPSRETAEYENSPNEFLFRADNIGRFFVSGGSIIRVDPDRGGACDKIRTYVFGSMFGILLHQRRTLPLHASAISTPKGAVLFSGPSGFGKSTLAAEFFRRGYQILSDDICSVSIAPNRPLLHPARASLFLRADSLNRVAMHDSGLSEAPLSSDKFTLPVGTGFSQDSTPIHGFYALHPTLADTVDLQRLSGFDKVDALSRNIFRPELLLGEDAATKYIDQIGALARHVRVSRVCRPKDAFLLAEMADMLEHDFLS